MESKQSHQDSVLIQKVPAVSQSFLGDHFCLQIFHEEGQI